MLEKPEIMVSCEDPNTTYLCYRDMRFIFRDGEYAGWYRPENNQKKRACKDADSLWSFMRPLCRNVKFNLAGD